MKYKLKDRVIINHHGEEIPVIITGLKNLSPLSGDKEEYYQYCVLSDKLINSFWPCNSYSYYEDLLTIQCGYKQQILTKEEYNSYNFTCGYFVTLPSILRFDLQIKNIIDSINLELSK